MKSGDAPAISRFDCHVVQADGSVTPSPREIIEEHPLRIVVNTRPVVTLMRTPGHESELALGFLVTAGMVESPAEVERMSLVRDESSGMIGEVRVELAASASDVSREPIHGDAWQEEVARGIAPFTRPHHRLRADDILRRHGIMLESQEIFRRTGAAHAAALAPRQPAPEAKALIVREDLGRHNALDKAVGAALHAGMPPGDLLLCLSSRLSFELVVKAARARISDVAGVGAPSASAVRLARRLGMFLAGFARGATMTVYSGIEALTPPDEGGS